MLDERWAKARNLLLMRLDNIGDVILLTPSLIALQQNLPKARITLMASPAGAQAEPLLPPLDEIFVWRALWQDVGGRMPLDPERELQLVAELRKRQFDAAIVFTSFSQSPHGPAFACYLAGIPLRLGESKEFGGGLLTDEVRSLPDELYQAERGLRMLESLGIDVRDRRPRLRIPPEAQREASSLLLSRGVDPTRAFVVVHPGGSCQARRYPLDRFAAVARLLSRRVGLPVLLTGSSKEAPELEAVASADGTGVISLAGSTQVAELAAVVEKASLVICNDSLPLHLSEALQRPTLALFSGTDLESQWIPSDSRARVLRRKTPCSPCYRFQCPTQLECLEFTPLEVVREAEKMLAGEGISRADGTGLLPEVA